MISLSKSSPPSSPESSPNADVRAPPVASENIKPDKQSSVASPSRTTRVPSPAGMNDPVNENPRTVDSLPEIINPAAAASPPEAYGEVKPQS